MLSLGRTVPLLLAPNRKERIDRRFSVDIVCPNDECLVIAPIVDVVHSDRHFKIGINDNRAHLQADGGGKTAIHQYAHGCYQHLAARGAEQKLRTGACRT